MFSTSIKMKATASLSLQQISCVIKADMKAELVSENWRGNDTCKVGLLTFDKYFKPTASYASLTVMLTEDNGVQTADIIGYGGGEKEPNASLGANNDYAYNASEILKRYGFVRQ